MSNFDFNKAINGEPIYRNDVVIRPSYNPINARWCIGHTEWTKGGQGINTIYALSTDQPKKKVIVTAYVYRNAANTFSFFNQKLTCCNDSFLGVISGEVEI